MKKEKIPMTSAIREMREKGVGFVTHTYRFQEGAIADIAARELGMDPHVLVKTLVFEDDQGRPFLVLMHADWQVSAKGMARAIGVKGVILCDEAAAHRHTGYLRGGTSPFGVWKKMPVYIEAGILEMPVMVINAGKRGLMAEMPPSELVRALNPTPVNVAMEG